MAEDENTGQPLFGFSASSDKSVGFWDLRAGSIQRIMLGHSAEVHSVLGVEVLSDMATQGVVCVLSRVLHKRV